MRRALLTSALTLVLLAALSRNVSGQQNSPPGQALSTGPPLSPAEAIQRMTVPDGFTVELVASEPEIVNPLAMAIDERGRFWIAESTEYPRQDSGPGNDRIKILEDTDLDGKVDKVTVFAEGFNVPSGIALGYGGVWIANSPDLLLLKDTDGDDKADDARVVLTGFGRSDTHALPNSLTWGPDGYLYGLNGETNPGELQQDGRTVRFNSAMFRVDPRTHELQVFCQGTSNPWGLTFNAEGDAFASASMVDRLWHFTETGYYLRRDGMYPPFVWHIDSIVSHETDLRAHCGLHYFDSPAYPATYRDRLYMGNIHAGSISSEKLARRGSTYVAESGSELLRANDSWFMPVAQLTGPDGCLYVLDWYDQYHCYADALRDPKGIDRQRGRLYRIRYHETPRAPRFNLLSESDEQLMERLHDANIYFRSTAQRILAERQREATRIQLRRLILDENAAKKTRLHALWALIGMGDLDPDFSLTLLRHADPAFRSGALRAAGNQGKVASKVRNQLKEMARDTAPGVQLQLAITVSKIPEIDPLPLLTEVLVHCGEDPLIPHIIWENLHPLLATRSNDFLTIVKRYKLTEATNLANIMPQVTDRILAESKQ